jgi:peptide deformylase
MGNPFLHEVAAAVSELGTPQLQELIEDMWETMAARNGAGLAAPQIGVGLRVVVFAVQSNPRYPDAEPVPRTVLINPTVTPIGSSTEAGWEGCLSVPGMRGLVSRPDHIHYTGTDADGNVIDRQVSGFHARVVQHECDHLDGILYPQRMRDLADFGFEEEISLAGRYASYVC